MQSEKINELAAALCKVQISIKNPSKTAVNPFFKSKYATLDATIEVTRKPSVDNGLSFTQLPKMVDGQFVLQTMLMHVSGQYITSEYPINPVKSDPQGYASAVTYARRYSLSCLYGICGEEDDDGNQATAAQTKSTSKPTKKTKKDATAMSQQPIEPSEVSFQKKLGDLVILLYGKENAGAELEHLTEYEKDGVLHKGVNTLVGMSDAQAQVVYGKLKKSYSNDFDISKLSGEVVSKIVDDIEY